MTSQRTELRCVQSSLAMDRTLIAPCPDKEGGRDLAGE